MINRKDYFKKYYQKNKEQIKENVRRNRKENKKKFSELRFDAIESKCDIILNDLTLFKQNFVNIENLMLNKKIENNSFNTNKNIVKTFNLSTKEIKKITLKIDDKLISLIDLKYPTQSFSDVFFLALDAFNKFDWEIEKYVSTSEKQVRKDVRMNDYYYEIYQRIPLINKMKSVNFLLIRYLENN